jgi:hypothetical protein
VSPRRESAPNLVVQHNRQLLALQRPRQRCRSGAICSNVGPGTYSFWPISRLSARRRLSVREFLRDGDRVAVAQTECIAKVNLAEQLDLVGGVFGLIGLKGETAEAPGDRDGSEVLGGLAGSCLPVRTDLSGGDVPPARASLEWSGQAQVEGAGQDREPHQLLQAFHDVAVRHQARAQPAPGLHDPAQVTLRSDGRIFSSRR